MAEENTKQEKPQRHGRKIIIIAAGLLASFFVALAISFVKLVKVQRDDLYSGQNVQPAASGRLSEEQAANLAANSKFWLGTSDPDISIFEFGDYACQYCHNSFFKIREISARYQDRLRYAWLDFPALGQDSLLFAQAARCAGEQGLFWPMHDKLFQNYDQLSVNVLKSLAAQAGVDSVRFAACLDKQKYLKDVQAEYKLGLSLGVEATPTWFINGQKIAGDIPRDIFLDLIEHLLKNTTK